MSENLPTAAVAWAARLRALTPARVGLGRTGVSLRTRDVLDFQRAQAQARDAVHARLQAGALAAALAEMPALCGDRRVEVLRLHSAAPDRATYLQRPDLGRKLDEASRTLAHAQAADSERCRRPQSPSMDQIGSSGAFCASFLRKYSCQERLAGLSVTCAVAESDSGLLLMTTW